MKTAEEMAHTPGTPYVFFNVHTGMPVAIMSSGDYSTIMLNKNADHVFVPMMDTSNWENLRLVDINTLEIKQVAPTVVVNPVPIIDTGKKKTSPPSDQGPNNG